MLERIEWVAGGWSLTVVLAQRESHWCLATQTCLLLFYILSTYKYSSNLTAFDPKTEPKSEQIFRSLFRVRFQVDSQVDFQASQGPSKGVPPRFCQTVVKTDTFASRIRIKRDPLHFQKFWTFSGSPQDGPKAPLKGSPLGFAKQ